MRRTRAQVALLVLFLANSSQSAADEHYHYADHRYSADHEEHGDYNPEHHDHPYDDHHHGEWGTDEPHYASDHHPDHMDEDMHDHDPYDEHHYRSYYYYGDAGSPDSYYTHGSLLLDDVDAYKEFMAMDSLETAVVGVFDDVETLDESKDHAVFRDLAADHSHMMRFAHTNAPAVMSFLEMKEPGVFLYPAARLAANHPNAGARIHYPGRRLIRESLEKFLFMESAPYVGQYDWRASERAQAVDVPVLVVFAKVDELHHSYHHSYAEDELAEDVENVAGAGFGEEESGKGEGGEAWTPCSTRARSRRTERWKAAATAPREEGKRATPPP